MKRKSQTEGWVDVIRGKRDQAMTPSQRALLDESLRDAIYAIEADGVEYEFCWKKRYIEFLGALNKETAK